LRTSRDLVRLSKDVLGAMNRKEDPRPLLKRMRKEAADLRNRTSRFPEIYHTGYVEGALAEVVEICILFAIMNGEQLPAPRELSATPEAYLLGLGDVIGELRRLAVEALRATNLEVAEARLSEMERVYDLLMRFDLPDAIVPLRRKQDTGRGLIERTRGEVLVARSEKALKDRLDRVAAHLERTQQGQGQGHVQQQVQGQGGRRDHRHDRRR